MTRIPPLLPEEALVRVMRLARFDGMGVLTFSGIFAVLSALSGDRSGAMFGLLIAGAGAIELHGNSLLQHAEVRGMRWLIVSQLFLMVVILGYCQYRLENMDLSLLREAVTSDLKQQIAEAGWGLEDFLRFFYRLTWYLIALATIVYQGGMMFYYVRRRSAVGQALKAADPEL